MRSLWGGEPLSYYICSGKKYNLKVIFKVIWCWPRGAEAAGLQGDILTFDLADVLEPPVGVFGVKDDYESWPWRTVDLLPPLENVRELHQTASWTKRGKIYKQFFVYNIITVNWMQKALLLFAKECQTCRVKDRLLSLQRVLFKSCQLFFPPAEAAANHAFSDKRSGGAIDWMLLNFLWD